MIQPSRINHISPRGATGPSNAVSEAKSAMPRPIASGVLDHALAAIAVVVHTITTFQMRDRRSQGLAGRAARHRR
jgi:hypothetical protein